MPGLSAAARALRPLLQVLLLYVLLRPVMGLGHELTVGGLAWFAHTLVGGGWWPPLLAAFGLDPVYAGAAIRAIGGVDLLGLSVADPIGGLLHGMLPSVFQSPGLVAPRAGVSLVAAPGTPALGQGVASIGADVIWLAIGMAMSWRWRDARWPRAELGILVQAQIAINHLLGMSASLRDLEASGLPFAIALALPSRAGGVWFTAALAGLPAGAQQAVIGGTLLALGYVLALALVLGVRKLAGAMRARWLPRHQVPSRPAPRERPTASRLALGSGLAILVALSPVGALAFGESNWHARAGDRQRVGMLGSPGATTFSTVAGDVGAKAPSKVRVERTGNGGWQYVVNGEPSVVRGIGYNPQYAALDVATRERLYERDFGTMRRCGINTIEGWFETQFDRVTLDAAARNGIGVIMPFEINQDWDLTNANVRQSILDHVSTMVETYRSHPAVRMWAPGNENMHRILYPHWVSAENDPAARARADAFAAFLPVLVDHIHALDPDHPVLYRDAEDVYLGRLKAALQANGVQRPWLIYGANVYAPSRLQEIITRWPSQWLGGPLLISEFAPGGAGPAERPLGFQQDWAIIRGRPDQVLGGLAYTWATNGPEELDRVFGLVDQDGHATDASLDALTSAYLGNW